jgi:hypothetical protein
MRSIQSANANSVEASEANVKHRQQESGHPPTVDMPKARPDFVAQPT